MITKYAPFFLVTLQGHAHTRIDTPREQFVILANSDS